MDERPEDQPAGFDPYAAPGDIPPPAPPPGPPVLPFEDRSLPWFRALVETVKLLFTRPRAAFARMPVDADVLRPFLFALLLGSTGIAVDALYNGLFNAFVSPWVPSSGEWQRYAVPAAALPFVAVLGPFWTALGVVLGSVVLHLFLLLVGGARRGFAATFRVVCYAQAPALFLLVPACGSLVAAVWSVVLLVIGASAAHRIGTGRAAFAVLAPLFLCCVCVALLAVAFGAALLQVLGGPQGLGNLQP